MLDPKLLANMICIHLPENPASRCSGVVLFEYGKGSDDINFVRYILYPAGSGISSTWQADIICYHI